MIQNKIFIVFVVLLSSIVFGLHVKNEKIEDEVKAKLQENSVQFSKVECSGTFSTTCQIDDFKNNEISIKNVIVSDIESMLALQKQTGKARINISFNDIKPVQNDLFQGFYFDENQTLDMKIQGSSAFDEITGENNIVATIFTTSEKFDNKFKFDIKVPANHEEMVKIKSLCLFFKDKGIIQDYIEKSAKTLSTTPEKLKKQIISEFSLIDTKVKTLNKFFSAVKEILQNNDKNSFKIKIKSKSGDYVDLNQDMQNIAILLMLQNIQGIEDLLLKKFTIDIIAK
jgi:hypothetical protein